MLKPMPRVVEGLHLQKSYLFAMPGHPGKANDRFYLVEKGVCLPIGRLTSAFSCRCCYPLNAIYPLSTAFCVNSIFFYFSLHKKSLHKLCKLQFFLF
jgi:hypothetical protein